MPTVIISGWKRSEAPTHLPDSLSVLLKDEAGMDSEEIEEALKRLARGKAVEAYFDLGEDSAAAAFQRKVEALGLKTRVHEDQKQSWTGLPPRPWFVKYLLGGLLLLAFWLWSFTRNEYSIATKTLTFLLAAFMLSVPLVGGFSRHLTEGERERDRRIGGNLRIAVYILATLIGAIVSEPWLGVFLVALALAGVVCYLVIRKLNESG